MSHREPYFLGELLEVDLSLINQTHPKLILGGWNDGNEPYPCSTYALFPEQTGGTSPHYALYTKPMPFLYNCPAEGVGPNSGRAFAPGQNITDHFYALLTSSSDMTLTGRAFFEMPQQGGKVWERSNGPLTRHLPVIHLHVAPQPPTDRVFTFQRKGFSVEVQARHLLARAYMLCQDAAKGHWPGGYDEWKALSEHTLRRPDGSAEGNWTIILWEYAIGAVKYAVVQG